MIIGLMHNRRVTPLCLRAQSEDVEKHFPELCRTGRGWGGWQVGDYLYPSRHMFPRVMHFP